MNSKKSLLREIKKRLSETCFSFLRLKTFRLFYTSFNLSCKGVCKISVFVTLIHNDPINHKNTFNDENVTCL